MLTSFFNNLYDNFICLDLSTYENFNLGKENTLVAQIVIMCVAGCMAATLVLYFHRKYAHKLVKALLSNQCFDEASAQSGEQLGVPVNRLLRRSLDRPSALSKLVFYAGQTHVTAESELLHDADFQRLRGAAASTELSPLDRRGERRAIDFKTAALYIPKPLTYRAEVRFADKKERPLQLILTLALLPIAGLLLLHYIPDILALADVFITFLNTMLA